jgi:hypothetical protein
VLARSKFCGGFLACILIMTSPVEAKPTKPNEKNLADFDLASMSLLLNNHKRANSRTSLRGIKQIVFSGRMFGDLESIALGRLRKSVGVPVFEMASTQAMDVKTAPDTAKVEILFDKGLLHDLLSIAPTPGQKAIRLNVSQHCVLQRNARVATLAVTYQLEQDADNKSVRKKVNLMIDQFIEDLKIANVSK